MDSMTSLNNNIDMAVKMITDFESCNAKMLLSHRFKTDDLAFLISLSDKKQFVRGRFVEYYLDDDAAKDLLVSLYYDDVEEQYMSKKKKQKGNQILFKQMVGACVIFVLF